MIEDIEINNFRCFDRLKVSKFKRINLISGKNNVGKTALLEAILLNSSPTKETIFSLLDLRRESHRFRREFPEKMWDNFFFQQDLDSDCSIGTILHDKNSKIVTISVKDRNTFLDDNLLAGQVWEKLYERRIQEELENNVRSSLVFIEVNINNLDYCQTKIMSRGRSTVDITNGSEDINLSHIYLQNASFMPSSPIYSSVSLTTEFDKARLNEKDDIVLRAFQVIDSSIIAVESFSIGEPTIYLKRQGEKRLPLSLFGDAMNRVAEIILKIINNEDSILLIDEIENGIHHSNQVRFWEILYKLAEQLNIQIFATTHSLEMTQAFIKAGLEQPDTAAHFELTRNARTNKIVAISRDLETLEYGINHNQEVRGEA